MRGPTRHLPEAFMWQAPGQTPHQSSGQHLLTRHVPGGAEAPRLTGKVLGTHRDSLGHTGASQINALERSLAETQPPGFQSQCQHSPAVSSQPRHHPLRAPKNRRARRQLPWRGRRGALSHCRTICTNSATATPFPGNSPTFVHTRQLTTVQGYSHLAVVKDWEQPKSLWTERGSAR